MRVVQLKDCRKCRRLTAQHKRLRDSHPDYWNLPVPASGPENASVLIVGLAPGMHGANRTGQPFTGDASGNLLHATLESLGLTDRVRITNAVKCLPLKNQPSGQEVRNCSGFLRQELDQLISAPGPVVLALGGVAHRAVIAALGLRQADYKFGHGAVHQLVQCTLVDSYHCSRYNTQTGRLTPSMFSSALTTVRDLAQS